MVFMPLLNQILVLFMILLVGLIIYRLKVIDETFINGLSRLVIDVTLPALIITSMSFDFSREILWESGQLFVISLGLYLGSWLLSIILLYKFEIGPKANDIFQFMLVFPNVGFMGYPVINAIYGDIGVFYASIFNFTYGLLVWTLGVWIFRRREGDSFSFKWSSILTPGFIAVIVGFIFFLFSVELPGPINQTLELLGGTTTPLSMLLVGALMARTAISDIWRQYRLHLIGMVRLIVIPLIALIVVKPLGLSDIMLGVVVLLAGMPAAANTAIFAERYGGDAEIGAKIVFITTFFSIITIPGLVFILESF